MLKIYFDLTKFGIVIFVLLTAVAGYAISFDIESPFNIQHLGTFLLGVYFLSSGSLALNQVQEYKKDILMPRTSKRPVATGKIKPAAAGILAVCYLFSGGYLLQKISADTAWLGWAVVILYNGIYTYWWKPKWIFAAVPGAIPGALPVMMGYSANSTNYLGQESLFLFGLLFLWQMPHFWALALRYSVDYEKAGVPTLPVVLGADKTLYHINLYTLAYAGMALLTPLFFKTSWVYILLVLPITFQMLLELWRFNQKKLDRWFPFFMWVNVSILVYLFVPVIDRWNFLFINSN